MSEGYRKEMMRLYDRLIELCEGDSTPFYFVDQQDDLGNTYRIFSYHAAIPRDFVDRDALEARGIMFRIFMMDDHAIPLTIASRPMQKFFNHNEHDVFRVRSLKGDDLYCAFDKVDGSLISSYSAPYKDDVGRTLSDLRLKSKASLNSDHARAAMVWLRENHAAYIKIQELEARGWTVNMEWVSPDPKFRIVVHYDQPKLIVLNLRHRFTGLYMAFDVMAEHFRNTTLSVAEAVSVENIEKRCSALKGAEGFVCIDRDANWVKLKSPWYLERHRAKDFINRPAAFIEMVIKEEVDDVLDLLRDQFAVYAQAEEWMYAVTRKMNEMINRVSKFYHSNRSLDRKEYAIKGQSQLTKQEFTLAMQYYSRKEQPDWKANFLRWIKKIDWGIPEMEVKIEQA